MKAAQILFPVLFMILLGLLCRVTGIISVEQKNGAKDIIFGVILPFIVFNAILTSDFDINSLYLILFTLFGWIMAAVIGYLLKKWVSPRYGEIVPFMLWTVEGGCVALPLYNALVGTGHEFNMVRFDMAGMIIVFVIVPIIVTRKSNGSVSFRGLLKSIAENRFIRALLIALICKALGLYELLTRTWLLDVYEGTIKMVSAPLTSIILFTLGHEMNISRSTLMPILKVVLIRIVTSAMIVAAMFMLFKDMMADKTVMLSVLVYFSSPPGFINQLQVEPLYKDETDGKFFSTYLSLYMMVTLIAYMLIVTLAA